MDSAPKRGSEDHADVLIVGAGAAGGVAALRLQAAGLRVVVLEQGEWHDRSEYRGSEWDWELAAGGSWSAQPNIRKNWADYPIDLSESDMGVMAFNGVGGGTILYNGIWPRFMPEHFKSRSALGFAEDWPIDYDVLKPWYEETDAQFGVSGLAGNPAYPDGPELPLPPLPFGPGAMRVARALHERRWHWWPDANAIASIEYRGRHPCVGRGTCHIGCNEGAKSSADITHWKPFVAAGGRLITGARVHRVTLDHQGLANGAEWYDREGRGHFQPADVVLIAANGIGTPRLLLNSACDKFPTGLANRSDMVGRRLMLHPCAAVIGIFEEQLEGWQGQNGSTVQCLHFGRHDASRGFAGGAKWSLHPMGSGPMLASIKHLASGGNPEDYHGYIDKTLGHGQMFSILCEDLAEDHNRVVISPDLVDSSGIPAPKLLYRFSEDSRRNLAWNVEQASAVMRDAGAIDIEVYNPAPANAHLMGTARMGDDRSNSVVDQWCMTHDIPNLGIIDGSVFITSAPVNPTTTIAAIALRAADRLARCHGVLPRPSHAARAVPADRTPLQTEDKAIALSADELQQLALLGDMLIPAVDSLTAAGELILSTDLFARVLHARPDLVEPTRRALSIPSDVFAALAVSDTSAWLGAITVISAAYCAHPDVKRRMGYEGQVARSQRPDRYPLYIAEGLIDHMLEDGWKDDWHALA